VGSSIVVTPVSSSRAWARTRTRRTMKCSPWRTRWRTKSELSSVNSASSGTTKAPGRPADLLEREHLEDAAPQLLHELSGRHRLVAAGPPDGLARAHEVLGLEPALQLVGAGVRSVWPGRAAPRRWGGSRPCGRRWRCEPGGRRGRVLRRSMRSIKSWSGDGGGSASSSSSSASPYASHRARFRRSVMPSRSFWGQAIVDPAGPRRRRRGSRPPMRRPRPRPSPSG
jgi:hypothetical protein